MNKIIIEIIKNVVNTNLIKIWKLRYTIKIIYYFWKYILEEEKIIIPAIQYLSKKRFKVYGPYAADTIFLRDKLKKFDVILGMYHDQVLAPIKSIFGFKAINITLGLPFLRISPDHGPNFEMFLKNKSNPDSLIEAIKFLDK